MGELPSTLKNCNNLIMLDVGENMLSGPIPSWIGESMQQLIILNMRGTHFSGNLPIDHLCYLKRIQLLDLSRNNLSNGIPTCLKNFAAMSEKSINRTDILNREIPKEVGYLLGMVSLNLSRNNLSGEIPCQIGNLSSLESLDLSRNHLSGKIPFSLYQIDDLGKLDLSHNSLSGRIPLERHFETFDVSSFEGNIDLCGEQLNKSCPGDGDQTTTVKPQEPKVHGGALSPTKGEGLRCATHFSSGMKACWLLQVQGLHHLLLVTDRPASIFASHIVIWIKSCNKFYSGACFEGLL
ncbi:LRR receptor-like serine/threonine-protein kinase GSO1, partial [Mucuna pruriens]